jgi:hypothetical protein
MPITSGIYSTFRPESYLPNFVYFPLFFSPIQEIITLETASFEFDSNGIQSIIRLTDNDGNKITPFIDLSKYDSETKNWFIYYTGDRLPYRYDGINIYNMYPSTIGNQTNFRETVEYFDRSTNEIILSGYSDQIDPLVFYRYSPVFLVVENQLYKDLTDYTNITVASDRLSRSTSVSEFYYDFEGRLFTNQNLSNVANTDIKIIFNRISNNSLIVKSLIAANSGSRPLKTPTIDDYIIKLKGQYLRG